MESFFGLFGYFALCHVLKGTNEHGATCDPFDHMGYTADVLHGAARGHNTKHEVNVHAGSAALNYGVERLEVFGMNDIANPLHADLARRIKFEDTKNLLGPVVIICK